MLVVVAVVGSSFGEAPNPKAVELAVRSDRGRPGCEEPSPEGSRKIPVCFGFLLVCFFPFFLPFACFRSHPSQHPSLVDLVRSFLILKVLEKRSQTVTCCKFVTVPDALMFPCSISMCVVL